MTQLQLEVGRALSGWGSAGSFTPPPSGTALQETTTLTAITETTTGLELTETP
jgi:hypothetical protein